MKKRTKKSYSIAQRVQYHKDRLQSEKTTDNQKAYSRHWLDGVNDEHASDNLSAAQNELRERNKEIDTFKYEIVQKKRILKDAVCVNKTVFGAYINGLKARLKRGKIK